MTYDEFCIRRVLINRDIATLSATLRAHGLHVVCTRAGSYTYSTVTLNDRKLFSFSNFKKAGDDPRTISKLFFYEANSTHIGAMILHPLFPVPGRLRYALRATLKFDIVIGLMAVPFVAYFEAIRAFLTGG